jgi:UDP-2,4-diacetamido-2,4,6-trideoxy-beta-L-altropyranose hydrolase
MCLRHSGAGRGLIKQLSEVCSEVITLPERKVTDSKAVYLSKQVLRPQISWCWTDACLIQLISRPKNKGCTLVCIDDIYSYYFVADAVINVAGEVPRESYKTAPYTNLLLGPKYALLRQPFLEASQV